MINFIEELRWSGMIHDMFTGTEEQLKKESKTEDRHRERDRQRERETETERKKCTERE